MQKTDLSKNGGVYGAYVNAIASVKTPQYAPAELSSYYDSAAAGYQAALEAAYQSKAAQNEKRVEQLAREYEELRRQTYVNSRLSAMDNNEQLAAIGLAGNAYDAPRSGYSETSRVAGDLALRNSVDSANRAERDAKDRLAEELLEAGYTKDAELARWLAELAVKQAQAAQEEAHFAYDADYKTAQAERDVFGELLENALKQDVHDSKYGEKSGKSTGGKKTATLAFDKYAGTDSKKSTAANVYDGFVSYKKK